MTTSAFWEDLATDLEDEGFRREFVMESVRIATIDRVVNALDDARDAAGLTKATLARAARVQPAAIRRMFSSGKANPTLGTLAEVATALGMQIMVVPLADADREKLTEAVLPQGEPAALDTKALAAYLQAVREQIGMSA